jgi:phosphohistidine phosphatase
MGRFLSRLEQPPDLVLTSSALRARSTVALAAEAGGWSCPVQPSDALYGASPDAVLVRVQGLDDALRRVLLVGHEPTWSALAARLTGGGEPRFPTATLARLDFDAERWSEIRFGGGTLVWLVTPKLLARSGFDAA